MQNRNEMFQSIVKLLVIIVKRKFTHLELKYKLWMVTSNALQFSTYFVIHTYV